MAQIINGVKMAAEINVTVAARVKDLPRPPCLAVVLVGDNPASAVYVRNKKKKADEIGVKSHDVILPEYTQQKELIKIIYDLNINDAIDGILVQLPLPYHIDPFSVICAIDPKKDVDCFHPENIGRLCNNKHIVAPCTPSGVMHLIRSTGACLKGMNAVVVGRSNIVGRPVAQMLLSSDCTVTITHSRTTNLIDVCNRADILVVAVGVAGLIGQHHVKKGAVVLDVGINRNNDSIAGDVDFKAASINAGFITPVPGGVGPMTIAYLMHNTVELAIARRA